MTMRTATSAASCRRGAPTPCVARAEPPAHTIRRGSTPHRPGENPMCPSRLRRSTQVATESTAASFDTEDAGDGAATARGTSRRAGGQCGWGRRACGGCVAPAGACGEIAHLLRPCPDSNFCYCFLPLFFSLFRCSFTSSFFDPDSPFRPSFDSWNPASMNSRHATV